MTREQTRALIARQKPTFEESERLTLHDQVLWERVALRDSGTRAPGYVERTNSRAQACDICKALVPAGTGRLVYISREEILDNRLALPTSGFGWRVFCADVAACADRYLVDADR